MTKDPLYCDCCRMITGGFKIRRRPCHECGDLVCPDCMAGPADGWKCLHCRQRHEDEVMRALKVVESHFGGKVTITP